MNGEVFDCIIQARLGSTRFPNKIFEKINNEKMVLEFLLEQLKYSKFVNNIIIATTSLDEDKKIVDFCKKNNIDYFIGDSENVLDRYYQCAKKFKSKNIVRITSDCPLIDPYLLDKGIKLFLEKKVDFLTNSLEPTFPHGLDFQIFTFNVLDITYRNATESFDKEHVVPYIINQKKNFSNYIMKNNKDLSGYRVTIDWIEDLQLVKNVVSMINKRPIEINDLMKVFLDNPELLKINSKRHGKNLFLNLTKNN